MRILIAFILLFSSFNVRAQFSLDAGTDMIILPLGIVLSSVGNIMTYESEPLTTDDFTGIDHLNIPFYDRWNTVYDPTYAQISDILMAMQFLSPLTYSFGAEYKSQFQTNAIMYLETMSLNYGLNSITKALVGRMRPFSYDTATIENVLYDYDTRYSFYSGHSSTAFASAVFNIIILTSQGGGLNKTLGVTLNLVNATAIATLRVLAAKHFLSDVLVGAIIGSGIAYVTTELHKDIPKSKIETFEPIRFNFSIPF